MFTIEVGQKNRDEKFSFEQLELFHQECMGGKIVISDKKLKIKREPGDKGEMECGCYLLICKRCQRMIAIYKQSGSPGEIIRTAIDRQKREIEAFCVGLLVSGTHGVIEKKKVSVTVCQKN